MKTAREILWDTKARFPSSKDFDEAVEIIEKAFEDLKAEYFAVSPIDKYDKFILDWAKDKGLLPILPSERREISFKQLVKLQEEVGELAAAVIRNDTAKIYDGFGDVYVVLVILASQLCIHIPVGVDAAWNQIKNRKGKAVNGLFIKEDN